MALMSTSQVRMWSISAVELAAMDQKVVGLPTPMAQIHSMSRLASAPGLEVSLGPMTDTGHGAVPVASKNCCRSSGEKYCCSNSTTHCVALGGTTLAPCGTLYSSRTIGGSDVGVGTEGDAPVTGGAGVPLEEISCSVTCSGK